MTSLIKIRLLQVKYEIKHLGVLFSVLLTAFFGAFELFVYIISRNSPIYVSGAIILFFIWYHLTRIDMTFLKLHIEKFKEAIFLEYFSFSLIFIIPLLFTANWYFFFIILIGIFIISRLKVKSVIPFNTFTFLSKVIPVTYFEALSFLRCNFIFISFLFIYLAAWCFCSVRGLPQFLLFLSTNFIMNFFSENEPLNLLTSSETLNGKFFLNRKLKLYILPLVIGYAPVLALNSFFQPDLIFLNLGFLILQILSISAVVLYKYAVYKPSGYFNNFTNPVLIFVGLSAIIPYLIPIILFLNIQYYNKAVKNLNFYLQ